MAYDAVPTAPPTPWSDGLFDCFNDGEVCLMGFCGLGCLQYLYAANAESAGIEDFQTAFFKILALTLAVPSPDAARCHQGFVRISREPVLLC